MCSNCVQYLNIFETSLNKNEAGWLVGDTPTVADLRVYQLQLWVTSGILDGVPSDILDKDFPALASHKAKVEAIPEVVAWRAKYGMMYKETFEFVPEG